MAGESIVQVTEGAGKKLHTYQRTIGANAVEDEVVIQGEHYLATYVCGTVNQSAANAGDDILQVMAGASLNVRIRRIRILQSGVITTAGPCLFSVIRVTTAGTLGTGTTPAKLDNNDAASGATSMVAVPNASHGTAGTTLFTRVLFPVQTAATAGSPEIFTEWVAGDDRKPIIIPAGITNGIVIRNVAAHAGLTVGAEIEFTETSFL